MPIYFGNNKIGKILINGLTIGTGDLGIVPVYTAAPPDTTPAVWDSLENYMPINPDDGWIQEAGQWLWLAYPNGDIYRTDDIAGELNRIKYETNNPTVAKILSNASGSDVYDTLRQEDFSIGAYGTNLYIEVVSWDGADGVYNLYQNPLNTNDGQ